MNNTTKMLAGLVAAGALFAVVQPVEAVQVEIYSNMEHKANISLFWNDRAVMVPFRTNESPDNAWSVESILLAAGFLDRYSATFQIWEDDPENRPDIFIDPFGWRAFDPSSHNLESIFEWAITGSDATGAIVGWRYDLETPLTLASDSVYWFGIDPAGRWNWRRAASDYDPAGIDISSFRFELAGTSRSAPVPEPMTAGLGMLAFGGLAGYLIRRRRPAKA